MYTISKKNLLELFQAAGQQKNEDIPLRLTNYSAVVLVNIF
jgi:hypothetical protein